MDADIDSESSPSSFRYQYHDSHDGGTTTREMETDNCSRGGRALDGERFVYAAGPRNAYPSMD